VAKGLLCIRRLHGLANWMEIWSTLLRIFTFQSFFDTQHILLSVHVFSLWVLQKKEPINVWSTVEPLADRGSHTYCSAWDFVVCQSFLCIFRIVSMIRVYCVYVYVLGILIWQG
jgi:hypothetical protein